MVVVVAMRMIMMNQVMPMPSLIMLRNMQLVMLAYDDSGEAKSTATEVNDDVVIDDDETTSVAAAVVTADCALASWLPLKRMMVKRLQLMSLLHMVMMVIMIAKMMKSMMITMTVVIMMTMLLLFHLRIMIVRLVMIVMMAIIWMMLVIDGGEDDANADTDYDYGDDNDADDDDCGADADEAATNLAGQLSSAGNLQDAGKEGTATATGNQESLESEALLALKRSDRPGETSTGGRWTSISGSASAKHLIMVHWN